MNCENCGSEIFAGQRFCRSCGRPTDKQLSEDQPTQMMPPSPQGQRATADTAPPARPYTNPVYTPPGYYQPPIAPAIVPQPYVPPRSRSGWGWLVGIIGFVVLCFILMSALFFTRIRPRNRTSIPPPPPAISDSAHESLHGREIVSNSETRNIDSFPMSASSKFNLVTASGKVTIEGWDQPQAEVTAIKRGGSEQDRRNVDVFVSKDGGNLSLRTGSNSGRRVQVEYVVRLPRKLAEIGLESASSDIALKDVGGGKVSIRSASGNISLAVIKGPVDVSTASGTIELEQVTGDVSVSSKSGDISLSEVAGAIQVDQISGNIKVTYDDIKPARPLKFASTSGDVQLHLGSNLDADLKADTTSGEIKVDSEFGINVIKRMVGQEANGRIGKGGLSLIVSTVSGDIKITK